MNKEKKQIFFMIWTFVVITWILVFIVVKKDTPSNLTEDSPKENEMISTEVSQNNSSWNYYEWTTSVTTTPLPEDFEKKLQEQWKIKEMKLLFNKNGFSSNKIFSFPLQTNIQLELDAGNTWLPSGTVLNLSIPWADLTAQISIPWRYKYSLFFKQNWDHPIILSWEWLINGQITKSITIK